MKLDFIQKTANRFGIADMSISIWKNPLHKLIKGAASSLFLNAGGMGLQLLSVVLIARLLGKSDYGIYSYAMAIINVLLTPILSSLVLLSTRLTAQYEALGDWAGMRGLWKRLLQWLLAYGVTSALLVLSFLSFVDHAAFSESASRFCLLIALPLLIIIPCGALFSGILRGLHYPLISQLPEQMVRPISFLIIFLCVFLLLGKQQLTPEIVIIIQVASTLVTLFFAWQWLNKYRPVNVIKVLPRFDSRDWFLLLLPLSFSAAMLALFNQTDVLLLGWISTLDAVGEYRVAAQAAILVSFPLTAVNMFMASNISRLNTLNQRDELQVMAIKAARFALLLALPLASVFWIWGHTILGTVFGQDYSNGYIALSILCVGQIVNVATGAVGYLLNMTGRTKEFAVATFVAAIVNIGLNVFLIPKYGAVGAAIATAMTTILYNIFLTYTVYLRMGIHCTVFGALRRERIE